MKQYISSDSSKTFSEKPKEIQELINTALYILDTFGIPIEGTPRRLERMAIAFLASGDIKSLKELPEAKDLNSGFSLKTRDIINYVNEHFKENISSGSYDDIRRKDLKLLTIAEVVLQSNPNSATNDSTRGYSINPTYAELKSYRELVKNFMSESINRAYLLESSVGWDYRGRQKMYTVVKKVDSKLAELAEDVRIGQEKQLSIMEKLDVIKGMLVDMYT